ncbi:DUF4893 domain-containing protein [Brevundimonas sp.]|uniref:DUF4893 domain-containing protein n=1 Tax=Brevundimonas sp. TaxID=1871086 RepID=UPI002D64AEE2|nr:DUF4893 domain-containing protein [Brevundimonas sp.]HYC99117.1 DUF4893 domain-containing protein [Brevundimonas sp.]
MRTFVAVASLAVLLAACERSPAPAPEPPVADRPVAPAPATPPVDHPAPPSAGQQGGSGDWREIARAADASALGRLDEAWRLARAEAEEAGFAEQVEALGPLVDPNAGQAGRLQPAPGAYRCRTIKLGSKGPGGLGYVAYPWFRCMVELTPGGDLILTKATGSQRSRGLLYPDTDRRLVFIGAQAWGSGETGYPTYGQTRERDQIGVFERIGPERWRLVIPWPKQEAKLEILELVP